MNKKKIPDFLTEEEERTFWATHDSTEYEMEDYERTAPCDNFWANTTPNCSLAFENAGAVTKHSQA
jgi:hypothetical protein